MSSVVPQLVEWWRGCLPAFEATLPARKLAKSLCEEEERVQCVIMNIIRVREGLQSHMMREVSFWC